jgi:hypothetical protein
MSHVSAMSDSLLFVSSSPSHSVVIYFSPSFAEIESSGDVHQGEFIVPSLKLTRSDLKKVSLNLYHRTLVLFLDSFVFLSPSSASFRPSRFPFTFFRPFCLSFLLPSSRSWRVYQQMEQQAPLPWKS